MSSLADIPPSTPQAALGFLRSRAGAALVLLTAVAAALRFATLDQQSYWYDEAITASLLEGSLFDLFRGIHDTESTPPFYYLLGWVWAQPFGGDEFALRSLSALAGTLVVPVAYAAGRIVATVRIGLAAAALAAVNPMLIWYSQEARAYVLLALLGGASFVCFALARWDASRRRLVAWAVVGGLAIGTHYFAGFVVGAEALLLLLAWPRSKELRWAVGAVAAVAIALLPLAALQARHRRLGWVGGIDLDERVTEALQRLVAAAQPSSWAGATGAGVTPHVWILALAPLVLAAVLLVTRASPHERSGATLALCVAAVGIGVPIAMAIVADAFTRGDGDYFLDRNVLAAWVPLGVFVAAGLAARRAGVLGAACLAALVCWSLASYVDVATSPELQRDDWRSVADTLPDDGVAVVVYPAYQSAALIRQRPDLVEQVEHEELDSIVLVLAGFDEPPSSFRAPDGFAEARVDEIQHFRVTEYRRDGPAVVAPGDVARGPLDDSDLQVLVVDRQD